MMMLETVGSRRSRAGARVLVAMLACAACGPESGGSDSAQGSGTTQPAETDGATSQESGDATSQGSAGDSTSQGSIGGSTGLPDGSTGETSTTGEPQECRRQAHVYQGCPVDWPTMTAIEGFGATLTQASFGVSVEACIPGNNWNGMALGDPATPTLRIAGLSWPSSRCGPERWLGSYATTAWVPGDDPSELAVTITIEGFAGDWDNEIPEEPARIFGHLSGDLVGPFEAIRCDLLDQEITNCS